MIESFEPSKKNQWWEFPIQTGTELVQGSTFPLFHCYDGLARVGYEKEIVQYGGWYQNQAAELDGTIIADEIMDTIFPSDTSVIYILRSVLHMN